MNTISTDPSLLSVDLPRTLMESPSVSTFLPEEEASICPLLSNTNGSTTPHPLTPCADNDSNASDNLVNLDAKADTSSSSGSSGIGMDLGDSASSTLFSKHVYQHLQNNNNNNNGIIQDVNGHGANMNISKDAPSFVSWNWPLIRKCTFFVFMSTIFGMCAVVIAMIVSLPNTCNPKTAWHRGGVFYEIFPANFQDSNHDGIGDINGITNSVVFLDSMGITAVRLNFIFPSANYPDDYEKYSSLTQVADVLGDLNDMRRLAVTLHERNISLILDIPISAYARELDNLKPPESSTWNMEHLNATTDSTRQLKVGSAAGADNLISDALRHWCDIGVDGFFLKCTVDKCADMADIAEWKQIIGGQRILIVSEAFIDNMDESQQDYALSNIEMVHVQLDISNGTKHLEERLKTILSGKLAPRDDGVWIHWTIGGGSEEHRLARMHESANLTLAATLMQLMLPGSPSIFYGDQITLAGVSNIQQYNERLHHLSVMQWINSMLHFTRHAVTRYPEIASYNFKNFKIISEMIDLRERSPSIYKNSICKMDKILTNTQIRRSHNDILIVERIFPRRNTFVSISNFGSKRVAMDMSSMYYSGIKMLQNAPNEKVYFKNFEIGPFETVVVKLDK